MQFKIKDEWKNKTKFMKTKIGSEIMFNGGKEYTQKQLQSFFYNEYFNIFIEKNENEIDETFNVDDIVQTNPDATLKLTYINTIKQDEVPLEVTETIDEPIVEPVKKPRKPKTKKTK